MTKKRKPKDSTEEKPLEGLFSGLMGVVEKLTELAKTGEELSKVSEFHTGSNGKDIKGVYGFNVKVGINDKGNKDIHVEPFGNIRKDEKSGRTVVQEVMEPVVDVFEEADHVLVVAELPGIGIKEVQLDVKDDVLTIHAERGEKKFHKELLLPRICAKEKMQIVCNNGILEIKCPF